MNNFIKKQGRHTNTLTKVVALVIVFFFVFYSADLFFDNFDAQSPIIFQSPIIRRGANRLNIEPLTPTPMRKKRPSIILPSLTPTPRPKATIQSFPKYLTDNGAANREKVLSWASLRYSGDQLTALDNIFKKEAGYREDAVNEIGACGIGQALPCEKMGCPLDQSGLECQYNWVVKYITNRYGTPINAWKFHLAMNWY